MERSVVIAGFGGQGILFAGQVLAQAAMRSGLHTFWIPTYGPEMRGGTAACTIIVADTEIGSPVVDRADAVIALNPPSLARYSSLVVPGGVLVVNSTLVEAESGRADVTELRIPLTALALLAGDDRLVSVAALGALLSRLQVVSLPAFRTALEALVGAKHPEILSADLAAFSAGLEAGTSLAIDAPALEVAVEALP
jgi:2-oxoglutarate ferredoxin oxidoreductase subunit gamma